MARGRSAAVKRIQRKAVDARDVGTLYALDVVARRIPAGPLHVLACKRHLEDLVRLPKKGYVWDLEEVLRFTEFCALLKHPAKGEWSGQPILLQPWQVFVLGSILGWRGPDGRRRFRFGYVEVPRKNGKTLMLALLLFYLTFFSAEPGAEGYAAATSLDQAKLVYNVVKEIVEGDPWLRKKGGKGTIEQFGGEGPRSVPRLFDHATKSYLEPIPANFKKRDGFNPFVYVADELHEHASGDLVAKLRTGMGARREPLGVAITTAGWDRSSYCYRERQRHQKILEGKIEDEARFAFIAHRDPKLKWWSKRAVQQANPSLGVTIRPEWILAELAAARHDPVEENTVRRMYLCDWVTQLTRWLPVEWWEKCQPLTKELLATLDGRPCFGGLDLSSARDMTAFILLFPLDDGTYAVRAWFWVPEEAARKRETENLQTYTAWMRDGFLTQCEGNTIDYAAVKRTIGEQAEKYRILTVGFDPWHAAELAQELELEFGLEVVAVTQGMSQMAEPTSKLKDLVKARSLRHGDNPVLAWMVENAAAATDKHGNQRLVKPKTETGQVDEVRKIDGLVATAMALKVSLAQPLPTGDGGGRLIEGWSL